MDIASGNEIREVSRRCIRVESGVQLTELAPSCDFSAKPTKKNVSYQLKVQASFAVELDLDEGSQGDLRLRDS